MSRIIFKDFVIEDWDNTRTFLKDDINFLIELYAAAGRRSVNIFVEIYDKLASFFLSLEAKEASIIFQLIAFFEFAFFNKEKLFCRKMELFLS